MEFNIHGQLHLLRMLPPNWAGSGESNFRIIYNAEDSTVRRGSKLAVHRAVFVQTSTPAAPRGDTRRPTDTFYTRENEFLRYARCARSGYVESNAKLHTRLIASPNLQNGKALVSSRRNLNNSIVKCASRRARRSIRLFTDINGFLF